MSGQATFAMDAVVVGVGATAVMDLWAVVQRRLFGIPSLDFAMVGRWLGHLPRGQFRHDGIGCAAAVGGERALGWTAHYVTGVVFAALLLAVAGSDWVHAPTLWPALAFGILSVAAPFFILQPGMGAGIAASKTLAPGKARLRSLVAHSVFGVGMYLSALLLAAVRAG
ncbi:DUF2938 domain-containing protein [Stenotrophomonas sp. GD03958]|uniref:DUF2938 domain-containing protein n=1 Tax=Stenotrophomonas sp. GD03958 TaxID=2975411 RepID=UPI0024478928|nr:DUF2938 domain-containing protein [Stenotrophomonas sp. GD03958]MDH1192770.1 DUF2938 domain-containing protein [Stenotrophomonas sp. GD03958]